MAIIKHDLSTRKYKSSNETCLERPTRSKALAEIKFAFLM